MYWFTGDLHCQNKNVRMNCNRPFTTMWEHDAHLAAQWNAVVQPKDHVFVLGDFIWKDQHFALKYVAGLRGRIHFMKGNHDRGMKGEVLNLVEVLPQYHELTVQDRDVKGSKQLIVMCHYPLESWNRKHWGSWHAHSHCHGNLPSVGIKRLDVGIDNAKKVLGEYRPFSYDEVKGLLNV